MVGLTKAELDMLEATRFKGAYKYESDVWRAGLILLAKKVLGAKKVVEILGEDGQ